MSVRAAIVRGLLAMLNSRWVNDTPCQYGFIGNVKAFDIEHLRSEVRQRPELTVAQLVQEAEIFAACPMTKSLQVIEGATIRDADVWDMHELRGAFGEKPKRPWIGRS